MDIKRDDCGMSESVGGVVISVLVLSAKHGFIKQNPVRGSTQDITDEKKKKKKQG